MVLNRSDKPLYLMPGEIIYGGQQDRTIGEEAIIPPGKKPVAIEVFCVEQGRWAAREDAETSEALDRLAGSSGQPLDAKARQKLAEEAKQGKFVAHAGSLNKGGRAAVQEGKGQQEVWDKVGEANASSGVRSRSDAFTANYTDPKVLKQLQAYVEALQSTRGQPQAGGRGHCGHQRQSRGGGRIPIHSALPEALAEVAQEPRLGRLRRGRKAGGEKTLYAERCEGVPPNRHAGHRGKEEQQPRGPGGDQAGFREGHVLLGGHGRYGRRHGRRLWRLGS